MTGAGFLASVRIIAAKDLAIEWKTREGISAMALFSLIVLVVFNFAFDLSTIKQLGVARLVPGILWVTLAFAGVVGFTRSFQVESRRDSLTAILMAPVDRGALFVGKSLSNLILLVLLECLILPLSAIFFDFNLAEIFWPFTAVVLLHTLGLAEMGTLLGAVAAKVGRGEALLSTLLFPVTMPLFISAMKCTTAVLDGKPLSDVTSWLTIAAAFDLLFLFVGLMTFEFVVEE
jgi:heme exporter protein B